MDAPTFPMKIDALVDIGYVPDTGAVLLILAAELAAASPPVTVSFWVHLSPTAGKQLRDRLGDLQRALDTQAAAPTAPRSVQ